MNEERSPILIALTATAVVVSLIVVLLYSGRCSEEAGSFSDGKDQDERSQLAANGVNVDSPESVVKETDSLTRNQGSESLTFSNPKALMDKIVHVVREESGEQQFASLVRLIGDEALTEDKKKDLLRLIQSGGLLLDPDQPVQMIGLLQQGKQMRWAMNLANQAHILFDFKRQKDGSWKVASLEMPSLEEETGAAIPGATKNRDALSCAYHFVDHTLAQRFEDARAMVDTKNVSDASIAGLCILFEEGNYQLRAEKPLRSSFQRDLAAGFIINVVSGEKEEGAEFSLIVQRPSEEADWKVYEVNLDKLIQDYAKRVAGGDVYYTPLAKDPRGGQTLVIYFQFDQEGLTERNRRQLHIVSRLLKLDPDKSIVISGHTDGKGSAEYNQSLSGRRASAVVTYLTELGVDQNQIRKEAHGMEQPRRPNTLDDGRDDPTGRRANRRTEIYLDF